MPILKKIDYNLQYDPKEVDIRLQHFTVKKIVEMIEKGQLEIVEENDLQRLPDLWDERRKSLLIESLMISLPLPMFYLDGSNKPWQVIDGLQRLTTLYQFISSKSEERFNLKHLEYLRKEYNGFSFEKLPIYMKSRILSEPIEAFVINPGTSPAVKYSIFQRINTLGLKLNGQEVRNAVYKGVPADFTKKLAKEPSFIQSTNGKVTVKRMVDREYVTRFIAFQLFRDSYSSDIDEFLRYAMQALYDVSKSELEQLHFKFVDTMERSVDLLGPYCFYRLEKDGQPKGRIPNKALFDTLSWNLSQLTQKQFSKLLSQKQSFTKRYINLLNGNEEFYKSINDTTSSKKAVNNRFNILNEFIQDQL
jgi:hypothetical protein